MKTIRQIADELGVTKQAVFKRIKTPPLSTDLEPFISKVDGAVVASEKGEKLILQAFADKQPSTKPSTKASTSLQTTIQALTVGLQYEKTINEDLRERIAELQKEKAELQERNDSLTAALIAAAAPRNGFFRRLFARD
jgi:predicted transcriptional regulator